MIPGIKLNLSGTELVVPPILLADIEEFQDRLATYTGSIDKGSLEFVFDISLRALKRNYPEMTLDELRKLVDLGNFMELYGAVMDAGGLKRKAQDAEKAQASSP